MNIRASVKGPAFAFGAAFLFGASTPFAKALLGAVDPWTLAGLLYAGAGLGLLAYRLAQNRGRLKVDISKTDWPWLAGAILFGGGAGPVLLMLGLSQTDSATSSLLLTLEGAFTALLAWIAFREHVHARLILGMVAIAAGAGLLAWKGSASIESGLGPLLIAAACLAWAIDNNLTRKVALNDAAIIAMLKGLVAGAANLGLVALTHHNWPPLLPTLSAMVVGFAGYGVSLVLFVLALRELGAGRASAYFSAAPFIGAVLAIFVFHVSVTMEFIGAGTLMAFGVWLHLTESHAHKHSHEVMEHTHRHVHDAHHHHGHGPADPVGEPHTHSHAHVAMTHAHPHFPDAHHRHGHAAADQTTI